MPIHSSKKNKNHERFDSVLNCPDVQIDKLAKGRERKKTIDIWKSAECMWPGEEKASSTYEPSTRASLGSTCSIPM